MIAIVDYGMANLRSVQKAFERVGHAAEITSDPNRVAEAERVVLPGVGAFCDAIAQVRETGLDAPILAHLRADKPFLGICLGLQLLFDVSYEDGEHEGLGIVPGKVIRFAPQPNLKIPHMGWNSLTFPQAHPILSGIDPGSHVYFVHSYHVIPTDPSVIAATSDHGGPFVAMIAKGNLTATQFHPEKSQKVGLQLLKNFAGMTRS